MPKKAKPPTQDLVTNPGTTTTIVLVPPSLERALEEIRRIMEREGLLFCFLEPDRRIYFIRNSEEFRSPATGNGGQES